MSTFWKAVVVLVLTLPVAAYAVGTLTTGPERLPDERPPVVVNDPQPVGDTSAPASPSGDATPDGVNKGEDRDDDGDDSVEIIRPEPDDVDDDRGAGGDDGADGDRDDGSRGGGSGDGGGEED